MTTIFVTKYPPEMWCDGRVSNSDGFIFSDKTKKIRKLSKGMIVGASGAISAVSLLEKIPETVTTVEEVRDFYVSSLNLRDDSEYMVFILEKKSDTGISDIYCFDKTGDIIKSFDDFEAGGSGGIYAHATYSVTSNVGLAMQSAANCDCSTNSTFFMENLD